MLRNKKPPPDARIIRLREKEDATRVIQTHVKMLSRVEAASLWENKTNDAIKRTVISRRFEDLRAQAVSQLDERRQRLAEKLYVEEQMLLEELKLTQDTPESQRAKLESRARELIAAREAERRATANDMLFKQWRESCDPLRERDSKAVVMATAAARGLQLAEKEAAKGQAKAADAFYHGLNEQERLRKEQRWLSDQEAQKARDAEAVTIIAEQLRARTEAADRRAAARARDVEDMKAKWAADDAKAKELEAVIRQKNLRIGEELLAFNLAKQAEMAEQAARERAMDSAMVAEAMRKVQEEEDRETEARERAKEESRMYRQHLLLLMAKEQENEDERDALIKAAENAEWAKREARWNAEQDAQRRLMEEVYATRAAQLEEKMYLRAMLEADKRAERARMEAELEAARAAEEAFQLELARARLQARLDIEAQIRAKQVQRQKVKEEAKEEFAAAQVAEAQYQATIDLVFNSAPPARSFGVKEAKWYY